MRRAALRQVLTRGPVVVDARQIRAYADATNDPSSWYARHALAPPVFGIVPSWTALSDLVRQVVPPRCIGRILHLQHEMLFHRLLRVGDRVTTRSRVYGVRPSGERGAQITARLESELSDGSAALTQFVTVFVPGLRVTDPFGHKRAGPGSGSGPVLARRPLTMDVDQTHRYRAASGDDNPIHVDPEAARDAGMPGIVVHGMCLLAMAAHSTVQTVGGDPQILRRLVARFAAPALPGDRLELTICGDGAAVGLSVRSPQGRRLLLGTADLATRNGACARASDRPRDAAS